MIARVLKQYPELPAIPHRRFLERRPLEGRSQRAEAVKRLLRPRTCPERPRSLPLVREHCLCSLLLFTRRRATRRRLFHPPRQPAGEKSRIIASSFDMCNSDVYFCTSGEREVRTRRSADGSRCARDNKKKDNKKRELSSNTTRMIVESERHRARVAGRRRRSGIDSGIKSSLSIVAFCVITLYRGRCRGRALARPNPEMSGGAFERQLRTSSKFELQITAGPELKRTRERKSVPLMPLRVSLCVQLVVGW